MNLPTGIVTFLFTDIEGSTKLWEAHPEAMHAALTRHDALLREAAGRNNGYVFKTVGDAFCVAFPTAPEALNAVLEAHIALAGQEWGETGPLRIRAALHTGEARERDNDYFAPTLNRTARLQGIAHGQQTLLSQAAFEIVVNHLPDGCRLRDAGMHRLKDLAAAEHVWQLLHPSLPDEFPPLKSLDQLRTNLPQQLTSFIGREKEMADIIELMANTRLLTLTGSGGTGKTRLSLQAAAEVLDQYPNGVWFVELAALSDPALLSQTVAEALSIREAPGEPIMKTLLSALKDRHMLLVLDNCEHLLDASAHLVDDLLKFCPKMIVLVSSREALGISGESVYRVPSLSLPDADEICSPESVSRYESIRLFIERAQAVKSDFAVTPQNASFLAAVCHRLDGIPLAVELAAARVRAMPVEQIEARLDSQFRLLTGGSRTALPRQQTLRALIDWSYDLLNEHEKVLLHSLSVFAGGWTVDAAETVCTVEESADIGVLDLLISLVDKSLVVYEDGGGKARYRLLETVRQYARDRLVESGNGEVVRDRHLDCFLALAEVAESKLTAPDQADWLQRLDDEHENLRAALEWSLAIKEQGRGNREAERIAMEASTTHDVRPTPLLLCGSLWRFWWTRGHLSEGREWCMRALRTSGGQEQMPERAKVLNGAGNLAWMQNDYASAIAFHQEGLTIQRTIGDRRGIAVALGNLGLVAYSKSDYATSRTYCEESLAIKRELGDRNLIAGSLNYLGAVADSQGDYASARAYYEESLTIYTEIGDRIGIASSFSNLGAMAYLQNDYISAQEYHEQSLKIVREIGHRQFVATSLYGLGNVALAQSDYAAASDHLLESLEIFREIGDRRGASNSLSSLGSVACSQGDRTSAQAYTEESLATFRDIGDQNGIAESLEAFAGHAAEENRCERAAVLWGAAEAFREGIGFPLQPSRRACYDRDVANIRQKLGDGAFSAAWVKGRGTTLEQIIEHALDNSNPH